MRQLATTFDVRRALIGAAAAFALAATGVGPAFAQEEKVINIHNWSDYIGEDTVKNFEKETGIKVRYDNFDSNEILNSKLVAGKSGYDIVVPSAAWAGQQIGARLLRPLDKSRLPNLANLDPALQAQLAKIDAGNAHLVTWLWGFHTVGINVDKVKAALGTVPMPDNAWELVFNPKYMARLRSCGVTFIDSPSEVMPLAMLYAGKPAYSKVASDYREAGRVLQAVRPYVTAFNSSGYINDLANGSVCVALGYSGDINIARRRALQNKTGQNIVTLIPKGSGTLFFDNMAIPADAPHPNNAHLWMNYILRPEVHAGLTNKVFYANPNLASLKFVNKDIAGNPSIFLDAAGKANMSAPQPLPADIRRVATRTYTRFKSGL
jgi:putrescine transport system substrate-binding protein